MAENYNAFHVQGIVAPKVMTVCATCGAVCLPESVAQHDEWHAKLRSEL